MTDRQAKQFTLPVLKRIRMRQAVAKVVRAEMKRANFMRLYGGNPNRYDRQSS